ncbi:MAG: DUF3368 domain-containing protein [Pyrinomonadaceae bacterium]
MGRCLDAHGPCTGDEIEGESRSGEASAITLALEIEDASLILDDLKARKLAKSLGLDVTGSVGVILTAKSIGVIPSIRPVILAIRETSFRLSSQIEREAFLLAGEDDK